MKEVERSQLCQSIDSCTREEAKQNAAFQLEKDMTEDNCSKILNSLEKVIGNDYSQFKNQTEPNDVISL